MIQSQQPMATKHIVILTSSSQQKRHEYLAKSEICPSQEQRH